MEKIRVVIDKRKCREGVGVEVVLFELTHVRQRNGPRLLRLEAAGNSNRKNERNEYP